MVRRCHLVSFSQSGLEVVCGWLRTADSHLPAITIVMASPYSHFILSSSERVFAWDESINHDDICIFG